MIEAAEQQPGEPHRGRRALVTGAGRGVGRAIALALGRSGAEVVVNDVSAERAEQTAAVLTAAGARASIAAFDVTDWGAVTTAVDGLKRVDILVNNAGNAGRLGMTRDDLVPFVRTEPDDWTSFLEVNLLGVMHVTRACLPGMIDNAWGRVVTIVSDAGRVGEPSLAAYSAAKAGAAGFVRSIAREVGRYRVTANCVSLATMDQGSDAPDDGGFGEASLPTGYVIRRRGRSNEVGAFVNFLCGPDAEWMTGQTYSVNGGYVFGL